MDPDKKPSRRHRPGKVEPKTPWWLKQFQEHPIATGSAALTVIGSLILLVFFCQLGETPDLDVKSFGAIPWAVAILALFLAALLTMCVFMAGLFHRTQEKSLAGLSAGTTAAFLIAPGMTGVAVLTLYALAEPNGSLSGASMFAPLALMVLASLVVAIFGAQAPADPGGSGRKTWAKTRRFGDLAGVGLIWALMPYIALLVFWALFPRDRTSADFALGLLFWTLCSYALNLMVAWAPNRNMLVLLSMAAAMGLFALMSSTGNWSSIPKAVVRWSGLGEMPVKLVLTADGCDHLNKAVGSRVVCRVEPGEKTAVVCPAMLRSRISSPFFVGVSAYESNGRWPQWRPPKRFEAIAIPKADAPTWTRLDDAPRKAGTPDPAASAAVVTYLDPKDNSEWLRAQCGAAPPATPASAAASAPVSGASSAVDPGQKSPR